MREVVDVGFSRAITPVMAFHAERTEAGVGDRGAFRQRVLVGRAQLMRIGSIMRIVTRRAGDRFVNCVGRVGVGVAGVIDELGKTIRGMATDTVVTGRPEGRLGGNRVRELFHSAVLV